MSELIPGAEPWSHAGDRRGALCVHGFTGNPSSMRPLAEALAAAGFTVELPRLPGHGTKVEDLLDTRWSDWSSAVDDAYTDLAARCDTVLVCGLSMGGALSLWLAARHPEIAGLALVNPVTQTQPELAPLIRQMLDAGETVFPGIGSDIAKEGVTESAYPETPLAAALSLLDAAGELEHGYGACRQPLLLLSSPQDHVVPPSNGDHLAATWGGSVERVMLVRSYHVATLDHDAELIETDVVRFARQCSGA
jgi:carboxylesterase